MSPAVSHHIRCFAGGWCDLFSPGYRPLADARVASETGAHAAEDSRPTAARRLAGATLILDGTD